MTQPYKHMIDDQDLTGLNINHLNVCINVMERVSDNYSFDMRFWQRVNGVIKKTEKDLHECGNPACFAGWLAVSPEFKQDGGYADNKGAPKYKGCSGPNAIKEYLFFETSKNTLSDHLCCTHVGSYDVPLILSIKTKFYGKHHKDITANDILTRLQYIKSSHNRG